LVSIMRSVRLMLAVLVMVSALEVAPLTGQAIGIPIRNTGVITGLSVGVDLGFGKVDASGVDETSKALGVTGRAGFGPLGVSLGVARTWINRETLGDLDANTVAATAELAMIGGPMIPLKVTWQAAAARLLDGVDPGQVQPWRASVGLGVAVAFPTVVLAIRPWVSPRLEYIGGEQGVDGRHRLKGAVSAGVDLTMISGLSIRAAYDSRLGWYDATNRASGISVGLGYSFR
jgi:hypothetical protein